MKPDPSLPLYDLQSDEAIEVLIQDKELMDFDELLSFELLRIWRLTRTERRD